MTNNKKYEKYFVNFYIVQYVVPFTENMLRKLFFLYVEFSNRILFLQNN